MYFAGVTFYIVRNWQQQMSINFYFVQPRSNKLRKVFEFSVTIQSEHVERLFGFRPAHLNSFFYEYYAVGSIVVRETSKLPAKKGKRLRVTKYSFTVFYFVISMYRPQQYYDILRSLMRPAREHRRNQCRSNVIN